MSTTKDQSPRLWAVSPVSGVYTEQAYYGTCLHSDCLVVETGRSLYRKKRGSVGQAEAAVKDHLRDKHGIIDA